LSSLHAPTKFVPLSDQIKDGQPLRFANLAKAHKKFSVLKSEHISKWTAFVTKQIKSATHTLITLSNFTVLALTWNGPHKSTPILLKTGAGVRRSAGRSPMIG
jgi:hypothetical protein